MKEFEVHITLLRNNGRSEYAKSVKADNSYDATMDALISCRSEFEPVSVLRVVVHPRTVTGKLPVCSYQQMNA